jgi:hypothetical protein
MVPSAITSAPEDPVSETTELSHPVDDAAGKGPSAGASPTVRARLSRARDVLSGWASDGVRSSRAGWDAVQRWWSALTPRGRQAVTLAVAAAVVVVAGVIALFGLLGGSDSQPGAGAVRLPHSAGGLEPVAANKDITQTQLWQSKARTATHGASVTARTYGQGSRTIRVVVARTDLTGKLELAWAADDGHDVGDDTCTQNVRFTPGGKAGVRPTVALCWRTGSTLSAYTLLIDPKHKVKEAEAAKALDEVWPAIARS